MTSKVVKKLNCLLALGIQGEGSRHCVTVQTHDWLTAIVLSQDGVVVLHGGERALVQVQRVGNPTFLSRSVELLGDVFAKEVAHHLGRYVALAIGWPHHRERLARGGLCVQKSLRCFVRSGFFRVEGSS